jgi:hypothetical protein
MLTRTLSICLTGALLAGFAPAQQRSSKIIIGDGVNSQGSDSVLFNGGTQVPFQNALSAIGSRGSDGSIEIMPGIYVISSTILIDQPGVRISGSRGAILVAGGNVPMFQVTAPDFVIDGVTLRDLRPFPPPVGLALVRAGGFSLINSKIEVANNAALAQTSYAIRLQGVLGAELFGCTLQSNIFAVGNGLQTGPLQPIGQSTHAVRRVLLRSEFGRNLRIHGNSFQSGIPNTTVVLGGAISLQDEEWSSITGNVFTNIGPPVSAAVKQDSLIVSTRDLNVAVPGESNHLVISANFFERCSGASLVCLEGHGFASITGNVFGRASTGSFGAVYLWGGTGNVVSGNNFHNIGLDSNCSLRATGGTGLLINSNSFSLPKGIQVRLDSVDGVVVSGNQFIGDTLNVPHLKLDETKSASITNNRFACGLTHAIGLSTAGSLEVFVCGNALNPTCSQTMWQPTTRYTVLSCGSGASNGGNPNF